MGMRVHGDGTVVRNLGQAEFYLGSVYLGSGAIFAILISPAKDPAQTRNNK